VAVVDSSPDDHVEALIRRLQDEAPFALHYHRKQPEGPGPSRNLGARHAKGEFLAFMDSDCVATPGWLEEGLAAFRDGVAIVAGRTIPEPGVKRGVFCRFVHVESEGFIYETANVFYRRAAFEEVGGFQNLVDPGIDGRFGGEDLDLAWRVKRKGWVSAFASRAVVHHEVRPVPVRDWLICKHNFYWPGLVGKFPELRRFFFARYFFDRNQAFLLLGLLGTAAGVFTPIAYIMWSPYVLSRASESTGTLKGPLRLLRPVVYLPRDLLSMALLLAGSIRFRTLLI
jgi:glycosyltransferase involved in cell wall biosynthesis